MKMIKKMLFLLLISILTACASAPTQQQIQNADYGSYQSPGLCSNLAEEKIRSTLKDPYSAQFTNNSCYRGWLSSTPMLGLPAVFGYIQTGAVNAKNAYGAYVGFRQYTVLVRNGSVERYCISDANGLCVAKR